MAQFGRFGFGGGRRGVPVRMPTDDTFGHGFNFCRGIYTSTRGEAGGQGWSTDYPDADLNFSIRLSELTRTRVARDVSGTPAFVTVRLTHEALFQCPYLQDRKSTRLNSSHGYISYAVFCLKKKNRRK